MSLRRLDLDTSWGPLTVLGGSRAGDGTLLLLPQLSLALDPGRPHGCLPPMRHVFVSHGHLDHIGGLAYWASQRLLHGMASGTLIVPAPLLGSVTDLLKVHARLEGSDSYDVNVVGVEPDRPYAFRRDMELVTFETDHWVPTAGVSLVWHRRKLRTELVGEAPDEIARRRADGEDVARPVAVPLLAYGADGALGAPEAAAALETAEVVLVECTFFDPGEHERADRYGHLHLDELASWAPRLTCRHLVVLHASRRHRVEDARRLLEDRVRARLAGELHDLFLDWG